MFDNIWVKYVSCPGREIHQKLNKLNKSNVKSKKKIRKFTDVKKSTIKKILNFKESYEKTVHKQMANLKAQTHQTSG